MRLETRLGVVVPSLLLTMITCLSGYATAGMEPSGKARTVILIAELCAGQPVAKADAAEKTLEDLVRLGPSESRQIMTCPKDQPDCEGSCLIPKVPGNPREKPTLKAEGKGQPYRFE